ncbi:MAG: CPBP family intramembrane metalloprotease [Lachnospiraceae bacterium]|nr:CPBP family intramembrane metalloprotease [Lachnospiraceae bacterium]
MIFWAGKQDNIRQSMLQQMWNLLCPWLVYEAVSILVMTFYMIFRMMTDPSLLTGLNDTDTYIRQMTRLINEKYVLIALFTCLISIPLMLLFMSLDRKKERRLGMVLEGWEKPQPIFFVLCFLCGVSVCVVFNHLLIFSGLYDLLSSDFEPVADLLYTGSFWLELAVVGLLTPLVEELIFRGLIYRRLRWALEAKWAAVLSALIFAFFHGNLLQGIYAFGIGLLMAFVYERYHHILAPVLVHAGANLISVFLSENEALQKIYETSEAFFLTTLCMMIVFIASFYKILTVPAPAKTGAAADPDSIQENHEEGFNGTRAV